MPAGRSVLAVSLNPALDVTYRVPALEVGTEHRVRSAVSAPGGKAVNVARVLAALGHPVTFTGLVGGATGASIRAGLAAAGVPDRSVGIAGETRRTVTVVDDAGRATGLWEPGPSVSVAEWDGLRRSYARLAATCRVVVLSGSLPGGVPDDAYAVLTRTAHEHDCAVVVDADGDALGHALHAAPDVVKPNRSELARVAGGRAPLDPTPVGWSRDVETAERLRTAGARSVVVSAGEDGMVVVTARGRWSATPPEVVRGNPTGAGDAAVAAIARGLAGGEPWPVILADAVALSAASVASPGAGTIPAAVYDAYRPLVAVREIVGQPCPS